MTVNTKIPIKGRVGRLTSLGTRFFYVLFVALPLLIAGCTSQANIGLRDQNLLEAIQQQDLARFKRLLEDGANPNAIFGSQPTTWVMCMAMYPEYEAYLDLVLEHGGDINLRNYTEPLNKSIILAGDSSPLLCAIRGKGYKAFNALMDRNVELDIKVCRDCQPFEGNEKLNVGPKSNYTTPINAAIHANRWEMVYRMMEARKSLRNTEINSLVFNIESGTGIDKNSDANNWRLKVAEKLNDMGHKVVVDQGFSSIKVPKWGEEAVF